MRFWLTLNRCSATKDTNFPTLNSFIDIIHSTENKSIKEGMTSVNLNYKSSRGSWHDFRRVMVIVHVA